MNVDLHHAQWKLLPLDTQYRQGNVTAGKRATLLTFERRLCYAPGIENIIIADCMCVHS